MPVYMIGYDLHPSEGEKYSELYTALETIGSSGYWDCLDSTWLVITEKTAAQIKDVLKQYLKEGDRLLVMRCGEGVALGMGSKTIVRPGLRTISKNQTP